MVDLSEKHFLEIFEELRHAGLANSSQPELDKLVDISELEFEDIFEV